jgi:diguanylate cyclase (GGDEF)-like protein
MDLDHFKTINDRFGHALGDSVLGMFADVVRQSVRQSDLTGRLGGEEFVALLYDISPERAVALAERIRTTFAEMALEIDERPVSATVSIGLVHSDSGIADLTELVEQADAALYLAKEGGRNRVEVAVLQAFLERREKRMQEVRGRPETGEQPAA